MKNSDSKETASALRRKARLAEALRSNLALRKARSRAGKASSDPGGREDAAAGLADEDLDDLAVENEQPPLENAFKRPLTEG
jgi:hypothetical protein